MTFAVMGFIYGFLRNFRIDIHADIDSLARKMDKFEGRMDRSIILILLIPIYSVLTSPSVKLTA